MFSVTSEAEARALLVIACGTNQDNEFIAKELIPNQTLKQLQTFGDRLADMHKKYIAKRFTNGIADR